MRGLCVFTVVYLYSYAMGTNEQCVTLVCQDCSSRSDQRILQRLEELDQGLQLLNDNLNATTTALESFKKANSGEEQRTLRRLEELAQGLQWMNDFLNATTIALQHFQKSSSASEQRILHRLDELDQGLQLINDNLNATTARQNLQDHCRADPVMCDCSNIKANGYTSSGVYRIYVVHEGKRYYADAFCDMTTANGGWTVFQRRKDGSEDFYRGWNDYANGFGQPSGEFWLGNNILQLLTSKKRYRLRIDLKDFEGGERFAEYSTFNITSSKDKYRLTVGGYTGDAGDSLRRHNNCQFTTKDADNDVAPDGNCAVFRRGAWWYDRCNDSNLNGLYLRGNYTKVFHCSGCGWQGIEWDSWHGGYYSLKATEMKIFPSVI